LISAERRIAHEPERVFAFLADLRNHWRLEKRFLELEDVGPDGGVVRLTGPFWLSRKARTQVLETERPTRVAGRADLRGGTVGLVAWEIRPDGSGSNVRVSAKVPQAWGPDRVFLALGGKAWLRRLFERALANLERAL
jgi:uncharacterized protein YndB with AHSA1/START domain